MSLDVCVVCMCSVMYNIGCARLVSLSFYRTID